MGSAIEVPHHTSVHCNLTPFLLASLVEFKGKPNSRVCCEQAMCAADGKPSQAARPLQLPPPRWSPSGGQALPAARAAWAAQARSAAWRRLPSARHLRSFCLLGMAHPKRWRTCELIFQDSFPRHGAHIVRAHEHNRFTLEDIHPFTECWGIFIQACMC